MRDIRSPTGVAALLLIALAISPQALAQEPGGSTPIRFSVTPSKVEIRMSPGESMQFVLQVINHSSQPLQALTYVDDVDIPDDEMLGADELAFAASRWMDFSHPELAVAGNGTSDAVVVVEVPEETPAGGYHALAFIETVGSPQTSGLGVESVGRIGATVLLEIVPSGSQLSREATVSATELTVGWDGPYRPRIEAVVTLENTGQLHLDAGGIHTFRGWPSQAVSEAKVGPVTVLRGTRHRFESAPEDVPLFGRVSLVSEIVYQVGPDDLPVIMTEVSVWVIPWHLIVPVGAGLLGLALMLLQRRRTPRRVIVIPDVILDDANATTADHETKVVKS